VNYIANIYRMVGMLFFLLFYFKSCWRVLGQGIAVRPETIEKYYLEYFQGSLNIFYRKN
jgi:hypothetical protein